MNPKLAMLLAMLRGETARPEDEFGRMNRLGRSAEQMKPSRTGFEAREERSAGSAAGTAAVAAALPEESDSDLIGNALKSRTAATAADEARAEKRAREAAVLMGGPGMGYVLRRGQLDAGNKVSVPKDVAQRAYMAHQRPGSVRMTPQQAEAYGEMVGKSGPDVMAEADRKREEAVARVRAKNKREPLRMMM